MTESQSNEIRDVDNSMKETINYALYSLHASFSPVPIKSLFAGVFVVFSFMFDVSQSQELLALFVLILLDFASGISAAKFNGDPIRSSKVRHTAIKMTSYFVVIAGAHLAESGLTKYLAVIDETVIAFFLLTELVSLLENIGRLRVHTPQKLLNQLIDTKNKL